MNTSNTKKTTLCLLVSLIGLFLGCSHQDAIPSEALEKVAKQYREEKTINDSLLDIACDYYRPQEKTLTISKPIVECLLYIGVREYREARKNRNDKKAYNHHSDQVLSSLLLVEEHIDLLDDPYQKGVVKSILGLINKDNGLYENSISYFREMIDYSLDTKDPNVIAVAYQQLAHPFLRIGRYDSALYYVEKALPFAPKLEPTVLYSVFHNVSCVRRKINPDGIDNDSILLNTKLVGLSLADTCNFYRGLASIHISKKRFHEADSLLQWIINHTQDVFLLCSAYNGRSEYYEALGKLDSALLMKEMYCRYQDSCSHIRRIEEIQEVTLKYDQAKKEQQFTIRLFLVSACFSILVVLLLALWLSKTQRALCLERQIMSFVQEMEELQQKSENHKQEIERKNQIIANREISLKNSRRLLNNSQSLLERKELELKEQKKHDKTYQKELRSLNAEKENLQLQIESMLRHFYRISDNIGLQSDLFNRLIEIYASTDRKRKAFVEILNQIPSLNSRHKVICMLIKENPSTQGNLWFLVGSTDEQSFQVTKSTIKKKLLDLNPKSKEIEELIKLFQLEKGPSNRKK